MLNTAVSGAELARIDPETLDYGRLDGNVGYREAPDADEDAEPDEPDVDLLGGRGRSTAYRRKRHVSEQSEGRSINDY